MDWKVKELTGASRRRFLKTMAACAAGLGVSRVGLLNYLSDMGGAALADDAACSKINRSVHLVCGGGSYAWMHLLWPLLEVARASNPAYSYHGDDPASPNKGFEHVSGSRSFYYGPEAPCIDWQTKQPKANRALSGYMAGITKSHSIAPLLQTMVVDGDHKTGTSTLAAVAAIQRPHASLLPSIGVAPFTFGSAPGAPAVATVPTAGALIDLFNSSASKSILAAQDDKALFETYYKAIVGLREVAVRPTGTRQLEVMKSAAGLVGLNLAEKLTPSQEDYDFYGLTDLLADGSLTQGTRDRLENLALSFMIGKKAMAEGLTSQLIVGLPPITGGANGFTDPHGAFADLTTLRLTSLFIGKIIDAFLSDLESAQDPSCSAKSLADRVIFTVHGDQPHDPFARSAWPDVTPGNTNWLYVMGNGFLKPGWFGNGKPDKTCEGWDPTTGDVKPHDELEASHAASAAILYAVANGDMLQVAPFYKGPAIDAVIA